MAGGLVVRLLFALMLLVVIHSALDFASESLRMAS